MSLRDTYEDNMQAQLDDWKTRLAELREEADLEKTNFRLEYHTLIDEVKRELEAAHNKLQLLRQASDETREEIKTDVEITWDSLDRLMKAVTLS